MGYISRKYLKEKWESAKLDMENFLSVLDDNLSDCIDEDDVSRVYFNIKDNLEACIKELENFKY